MYAQVLAVAALAGAVAASPAPAGVTAIVSPSGETAPSGCVATYPGTFSIQVPVNATGTKGKRAESTPLVTTLKNGVLTDSKGRTGYIADNNQFQFDGPPQAGAIYTAGFSICQNGTLALGNSAIFYKCLSGMFYNLYDQSEGAQCSEALLYILPVSASGSVTSAAASATVACQIADGQAQDKTCTVAPITQIGDGQIQASTAAVPITQIGDGQIQAPTKAAVITQIGDGQIQAPTKAAVISQISDGQIQAPTNGSRVASATPVPFTGAASSVSAQVFAVAAGLLALAAL